jgi:hypothetical protein
VEVLQNSENLKEWFAYEDKDNNVFQTKILTGIPMKVVFKNVAITKKSETFLIEGLTVVANMKDTLGLCCIDYFLAKRKGDSIYNIRRLGESNAKDFNPKYESGYFSFEVKIHPGDKLYFCGSGGGDLREFFVDRLLAVKKE